MLNALGFVYLIRTKTLFTSKLVSVRPQDGISWKNSRNRIPISTTTHPASTFITLMVAPKAIEDRLVYKAMIQLGCFNLRVNAKSYFYL
jgi:hypothetical protein